MGFRGQFRTRPLSSRRSKSRLALRFEELESRTLLSAAGLAGYLARPAVIYNPAQIQHAYQFDKIANYASYTAGAGQTIAIVDAYDNPNAQADLQLFDAQWGLPDPPTFTKYVPSSGTPAVDEGWALESSLDLQWAHAMAPGANIALVEANSASYSDLLSAVDFAASPSPTGAGASVVSMSWGGGEFSGESSLDSHFGVAGVTFVASSGDNGAYYGLSWPAASSNVVSVGGTSLNLTSSGNYSSESGWSGSGGGSSAVESRPSYQSNYLSSHSNSVPNNILRGHTRLNPDVAYNSDPNKGYYVYDSTPYSGSTGWWQVGGTSAAAPQWAAIMAIVDQVRVAGGQGALGSNATLTALYGALSATSATYASDFHDVKSGGNGYRAGTGYDLVTGLGSPVVNNVVAALAAVSSSGKSAAVVSGSSSTPQGSGQHIMKLPDSTSGELSPNDVQLILDLLSTTNRTPVVLPAAPTVTTDLPVTVNPNLQQVSLTPNPITVSLTRDVGSGGWLVLDTGDDSDAIPTFPDQPGNVPAPPPVVPPAAPGKGDGSDKSPESSGQFVIASTTSSTSSGFVFESVPGSTPASRSDDHEALLAADPLAAGVSCVILLGGLAGIRIQEFEERERRGKPIDM
jgi:subtilase family serine protease